MDAVRRIVALVRALPPASMPATEQADWFERKAAVFDSIAVENPHLAASAIAMAWAARDRAARLRAAPDPADGGAPCH